MIVVISGTRDIGKGKMDNPGSNTHNLRSAALLSPLQKVLGIAVPLTALLAMIAPQVRADAWPSAAYVLFGTIIALTALALAFWPASAGHRHVQSALFGWLRGFWWLILLGAPAVLIFAAGPFVSSGHSSKLPEGLSCLAIIGLSVAIAPIAYDRALRETLPQTPQTLGAVAFVLLLIAIAGSL